MAVRLQTVHVPCTQVWKSPYADAVMADSPVAYWPCQDCHGPVYDRVSGRQTNTLAASGSAANTYRQPGPLTSLGDKSIFWPGGGGLSTLPGNGPVTTVRDGWTLELWFYFELSAANQTLFYNGSGGGNGYGMLVSSGVISYLAGGITIAGSSTAMTANTWYHLALVRSGTISLYMNGALNTTMGSATPNTPTTGTALGDVSLQGRRSHPAVYATALSATRIAAHYAAR